MGRYLVTAALLMGLLSSGGCCWWAERWCPHQGVQTCAPPPAACYPAAQPCGYPTASYAPVAPPPNWSAPRPMNCSCSCTP